MNGFDKLATSLNELYAGTPVEEHGNIVVAGGRAYVRTAEGTEEYVLLPYGELALVRSDRALRQAQDEHLAAIRQELAEIKTKLGL